MQCEKEMGINNQKMKSWILSDHWLELLDELNIGAFIVNLQRNITSMNYSAQTLMGLKEVEVTGKACREIFSCVPCLINCFLREGGKYDPDVKIREKEGESFPFTRLATPIYGPDHDLAGCVTILLDRSPIADLIDRIHHEERSLKIILDNLDVGIFTVNRSGHITFFNKEAERISGYNRNQLLGKHYITLFEKDAGSELHLLKKSISDGSVRSNHHSRIATNDGGTIPIRANYIALRNQNGSIVGGLATFHDLTLIRQLKQVMHNRYTFHDMVGKDPAMQKLFESVNMVAETDTTILIEGETGTGKDLLSKVIHSSSKRSAKPFVKVNCAALPDNLLESEMFGYVKGAFTGADRDKPGRFNEADGGTIFLDEIGDIPLSLQAKLLRVLEDKEFYPLGSRKIKKVDVRIISATNRGLGKLVKKGVFREDLYYRLNVFRLELPILKDRRSDIPILINNTLRRLCAAKDKRLTGISETTMQKLLNYSFPGNIRELENILEHALIVCKEDVIRSKHLPEYIINKKAIRKADSLSDSAHDDSDSSEHDLILKELNKHNWNRKETALSMEIDRSTLWRKMKKFNLIP